MCTGCESKNSINKGGNKMWIAYQANNSNQELKNFNKVELESNKLLGKAEDGKLIKLRQYDTEIEAAEAFDQLVEIMGAIDLR